MSGWAFPALCVALWLLAVLVLGRLSQRQRDEQWRRLPPQWRPPPSAQSSGAQLTGRWWRR